MLLTFFLLTKTVLLQNADDGYAGLGWLKRYILLRMQLFSNPSSSLISHYPYYSFE